VWLLARLFACLRLAFAKHRRWRRLAGLATWLRERKRRTSCSFSGEIERLERKLEILKGELQELKKSAAAKLSFGDPEALCKARLSVGSKQAEKTDCEAKLTKARVELRQLLEAEISERRGHLEEWKAEYNRLRCELETAIDTEVVFERLTKLEGDRELVAPKLAHLIELKATLDATIACNSG